jgi:hypothetical protein
LFVAGGAVALAACGSSKGQGAGKPTPFTLVQRIPQSGLLVPGEVRVAVSIAQRGTLQPSGPATLRGAILDSSDRVVVELTAVRRSTGIAVAYWAFRATLDEPGIYTLRAEGDDGSGAAFQVFEPSAVKVPIVGGTLPPFLTPTVDDHRGVEPYCSLTPAPCPLHDVTLTDALASGRPVAYLIGTPAHCQTGTCAPGLEFLVAAHARLGDAVAMVHADVYADDAATRIAPAVTALQLDYEPVVYLCAPGGGIVDRLDGIWDATELDEALARIS